MAGRRKLKKTLPFIPEKWMTGVSSKSLSGEKNDKKRDELLSELENLTGDFMRRDGR